jgi:putative membrane protein
MAWIRTCLSMVSFGFAIDKFAAYLHHQQPGRTILGRPDLLGMGMVCIGVLLMLFAIAEHTFTLRRLGKQPAHVSSGLSLPLFGALTVLLIGVAALLLIVLHRPWSG